jgi:TRAP-type C4-dicarboxylate transport system substrate-binding protein
MLKKVSVIVTVLAMALVLSSAAAIAESMKLTFASALAPKSNLEMASARYAKIIGEKTNGEIKIVHYGSGSLYGHKDMIPALAKNQVNMGVLHVAMVGRRSPTLEFISSFGAQGCWESYDHYYRFVDNPRVREIANGEFDKYFKGKLLGILAFGVGMVGRSDKPIKTVEDFKGLKMRTSGTAQATMYRTLGAITVEMSSKELYTALQRGTIKGATTGTSRFRRSKVYEVAPYLTNDPTLPYLSFWLTINADVWAKLSPAHQKLFIDEGKKLEQWTRDNAAKEREDDLIFLKKNAKLVYDLPPEEKRKLIETVRPAMMAFSKKRLGDQFDELWKLLDETK